jgi:hypothetical protein
MAPVITLCRSAASTLVNSDARHNAVKLKKPTANAEILLAP